MSNTASLHKTDPFAFPPVKQWRWRVSTLFDRTFTILGNCLRSPRCFVDAVEFTAQYYQKSSSRSMWEGNSSLCLNRCLSKGDPLKLEGKPDSDERTKVVLEPGPVSWWKLRPQTVIDLEEA